MPEGLNIAFAGTPDFAATILQNLIIDGRHTISLVLSQPDKPAGRGKKLHKSPVTQLAESNQLPLVQPSNRQELDSLTQLGNLDVLVVAAYGMILSEFILQLPRYGCINIHTSLLPRWRGAAPIQRALLAGDNKTGITIIQIYAGLDTGDILYQETCPINPKETSGTLHDKLAILGGQCLLATLDKMMANQLSPEAQDNALAIYAEKIQKQDAYIDWSKSANEIERLVRAMNPVPVAFSELNNIPVRIWDAEILDTDTSHTPPGTIINYSAIGLDVASRDYAIRIQRLQLPGKKVLGCGDFYNGYPVLWTRRTNN